MYRDKYIFNVITSTTCIILSVFHELKPSYFTTKKRTWSERSRL